jgi:hypothetical protein
MESGWCRQQRLLLRMLPPFHLTLDQPAHPNVGGSIDLALEWPAYIA